MKMSINPDDFQPEEKNNIDLSLTREEKLQLLFYVSLIIFGFALLLGLWRSTLIIDHLNTVVNQSNVTAIETLKNSVVELP